MEQYLEANICITPDGIRHRPDMTSKHLALLLLGTALICACANQEPTQQQTYLYTGLAKRLLDCSPDRTPVCLERTGKPARCVCADKESLNQILEADKY